MIIDYYSFYQAKKNLDIRYDNILTYLYIKKIIINMKNNKYRKKSFLYKKMLEQRFFKNKYYYKYYYKYRDRYNNIFSNKILRNKKFKVFYKNNCYRIKILMHEVIK